MISVSTAYPPYSNYPSALSKPQVQKDSGASGNQDTPDITGEKKSTPAAQLTKQDPAKDAQQQKQIDELKKIDRNVHAHEQAHLAAAGGLAISGASFSYRMGPDGKQYAVGGEVSIDVSPGRTPQETINKAEKIQAAALAPADPSAQDRAVASSAVQMKQQAQLELTQEKLAATQSENGGKDGAGSQRGIASYRANSGDFGLSAGSSVNSTA